jgi:hypothetical protein
MYTKITALPVTGGAAALGTGVSVGYALLTAFVLISVGAAMLRLLPRFHRTY